MHNTTENELRHGVELIKCTTLTRLCGVLGEVLHMALTLTCLVTLSHFVSLSHFSDH